MANTKVTGDLIASSTIATGNIADNAVTSDKISGITTAHITEGSNLYYTNARSRGAISVSGNALSYNSSTGVITSNFEEAPTFTGVVTASRYVATGQNLSHGASRLKISQENTTLSEIRFYGADTSTAGALRFMGSSSDGSTGDVRMTIWSPHLRALSLHRLPSLPGPQTGRSFSPAGRPIAGESLPCPGPELRQNPN